MIPPKVVRIRKGFLDSPNNIYIGRECRRGGWDLDESEWHNPFPIRNYGLENSLRLFENYLRDNDELMCKIPSLSGKVLGCWCKEKGHELCHGDIIVKIFNEK